MHRGERDDSLFALETVRDRLADRHSDSRQTRLPHDDRDAMDPTEIACSISSGEAVWDIVETSLSREASAGLSRRNDLRGCSSRRAARLAIQWIETSYLTSFVVFYPLGRTEVSRISAAPTGEQEPIKAWSSFAVYRCSL